MKVTITICKMGGGFKRAIIGQKYNPNDGTFHIESVFGATNEELLARIKIRVADPKNRPLTVFD